MDLCDAQYCKDFERTADEGGAGRLHLPAHGIYKFCVQFVQKDFHFLPIANAVGRAAGSDRLILGDMASLGISYWNPNMVGCKN